MDSLEETNIVRICNDLIVRYTHFADLGEIHRIPELFTDDGIWATPTEEHVGQEALRRRFESSVGIERVTRHVCSNVLVEVISSDEATAVVYLTLYKHDGPIDGPAPITAPLKIGQYRDRLVRRDAGWRFAERRCSFAFA